MVEIATTMRVESGSCGLAVLRVEAANSGTTLKNDQTDHGHRQRDEHGRVDQRGDDVPAHGRQHLDVLHIAAEHLLQAAALLARHERRGVDAGKHLLRVERLGERRAGSHFLVDVVERDLERRVRHALAQNVERLHERQAGLEQRRQLLVEDEELGGRNAAPSRQVQLKAADLDAPAAAPRAGRGPSPRAPCAGAPRSRRRRWPP